MCVLVSSWLLYILQVAYTMLRKQWWNGTGSAVGKTGQAIKRHVKLLGLSKGS